MTKMHKRLLALILGAVMILSAMGTVSFAVSFTDVEEEATYSEAVTMLTDLHIIDGYEEDGELYFKPDNTITRAEAAKIIVCMLGARDAAAGATNIGLYTDCPSSHWAAGYVNYLTGYNHIIAGYGNGYFGPSDELTYEQVVKMLVCALGYYPMAMQRGGYPSGFLAVGSELGVTKGCSGRGAEAAKRGTVARMAYNALTAPLMKQTGWDINHPEYTITGTRGYDEETLLESALDVLKVNACVTETYLQNTDVDKDDLYILLRDADGSVLTNEHREDLLDDGGKIDVGNTDAVRYLGYAVTAYVYRDENTDRQKLIALSPRGTRNAVQSIPLSDLYAEDVTGNHKKGYYEVKAEDKKGNVTTYRVDYNARVYMNGEESDETFDELCRENGTKNGTLTLLRNETSDSYADYVFFEVISGDYVVSSTNRRTGKVTFVAGGSTTLDEDSDDMWVTVIKDDKTVSFSAIGEGDVLSLVQNPSRTVVKAYVCDETVEGKLSKKNDKTLTVSGVKYDYRIAKNYDNHLANVSAGDSGVFYLNAFDEIVYFDRSNHHFSSLGGFAYLYRGAVEQDKFGKNLTVSMQLFDKDGDWRDYDIAKKVTVYYKDAKYRATDQKDFLNNIGRWTDNYIVGSVEAKTLKGTGIVQFNINSDAQISELYIPSYGALSEDYLTAQYFSGSKYDDTSNSLGKRDITDDTVIFTVKGGDEERWANFGVASYGSVFTDGDTYRGYGFVAENGDVGVYDAILLYTDGDTVKQNSRFIVVSEAGMALNQKGDAQDAIMGYTNGHREERTFFLAEDYTVDQEIIHGIINEKSDIIYHTGFDYDDLSTGDVVAASFNTKGEITHLRLLSEASRVENDGTGFYFAGKDDSKHDMETMFGYVAEKRSKSGYAYYVLSENVAEEEEDIVEMARIRDNRIEGSVYYVDLTGENVKITVEKDFDDVEALNAYVKNGQTVSKNYGYFIYAKTYDNDVVDAVVYIVDCSDMLTKADYTAVLDAIATAPNDLSDYKPETVAVLREAIAAVDYSKNIRQQEQVDECAEAISDAIAGLAYRDADYSLVEEALALVPQDLSLYTDETVSAVQAATGAVEYGLDLLEQARVDGFAQTIQDAVAALVYRDADYASVSAAIEAIPEDLSAYTQASATNVQIAKDAVVYGLDISEQARVDGFAQAINDAVAALTLDVPADYTAVDAALASIPTNLDLYTEMSVVVVNDARNAIVRGLTASEQSRVDGYAQAVEQAIQQLVFKDADYTAVRTALATVPAYLGVYTQETAKAVTDAVAAVVEGKKINEQATVTGYATAISTAVAALVVRPGYAKVETALKAIPKDLTLYTDASVNALKAVLNAIVYTKTTEEQTVIDGYATSVENATKALVPKTAPTASSAVPAATVKPEASAAISTVQSAPKKENKVPNKP